MDEAEFEEVFEKVEEHLALAPPTAPAPVAVSEVQQLLEYLVQNQAQAPTPPGSLQGGLVELAILLVTIFGGGGAGWRAWVRSRREWHREQMDATRTVRDVNEDQTRRLNALERQNEEILASVKALAEAVAKKKGK